MVLESGDCNGRTFCGCQTARTEEVKGEAHMRMLLRHRAVFLFGRLRRWSAATLLI